MFCGGCGDESGSSGWEAPNGVFFCEPCWLHWWGRDSKGENDSNDSQDPVDVWDLNKAVGKCVKKAPSFCRTWQGCGCGDDLNCRPSEVLKGWSDNEVGKDLEELGYCDAHCHLDYCLLNAKCTDAETWSDKQWMCTRWQEGRCWLGRDCDYAHSEEELAQRPQLDHFDLLAFAHMHPTEGRQRRGTRQDMSKKGGSKLRCLITSCCEAEAIEDTRMLVAAGKRLLSGAVYCTFGCHPHNYREYDSALETQFLHAIEACGAWAVGWGECGLDYYKNHYEALCDENRALMVAVFARQARLAAERRLPLVVHTRDAEEDTLLVLQDCLPREHPVHIHAFQGSVYMLMCILDMLPNAIIGISGTATFEAGAAAEIARHCPLNRLVLETDAPYLCNEPREIPSLARCVAHIKGIKASEVLAAANRNCERFFFGVEKLI